MAPLQRSALPLRARASRPAAVLAGALAGMVAGTVALGFGGSPAARAAEQPYPPATTFRDVQTTTLACSRENTVASCGQARALADPLLDHPRLSSSCKDALWSVRQRAVVASANSGERRDAIDQASRDVAAYCRQPYQPPAGSAVEKPGSKPFSLLNPTNP